MFCAVLLLLLLVWLIIYIYIYTSKGPTSSSCNPFWSDFHIQTDKLVKANQPDIILVDKQRKSAVVIDVAILNESKEKHAKLEKHQGLREELEKMWRVKVTVVPLVIRVLCAVTPKLDEWLQQILGATSEIFLQESAVLGLSMILHRSL